MSSCSIVSYRGSLGPSYHLPPYVCVLHLFHFLFFLPPFFLSLLFESFPDSFSSRFLYIGSSKTVTGADQKSTVFAASFVILWVGAAVVTLNALLVGGTLYLPSSFPFHPPHPLLSLFLSLSLRAHRTLPRLLLILSSSGFFQSVCILGYCVFPLMIAAFVCLIWNNVIFRVLLVLGAIAWALVGTSSSTFIPLRHFLTLPPPSSIHRFLCRSRP